MTKKVIGSTILVDIVGAAMDVPAKVDTGADRSSIDVSNLYVDEKNRLHYTLFNGESPYFTGDEVIVDVSRVSIVKSSTGHRQVRYRAPIKMRIDGRIITVDCNLSNRAHNKFPILIGRRTLNGKFLVDVSQFVVKMPRNTRGQYNKEMKKDPRAFFEKYYGSQEDNV